MTRDVSVILPARNEAAVIGNVLDRIKRILPSAEIIVVDDGSHDETGDICRSRNIHVLRHPYPLGNGAAIKAGARAARGETLIFLDADGQHQPEDLPALLSKFDDGYDMVVGARTANTHAGAHRAVANGFFSRFASWTVGQRIEDLTSGFRVANARKFRRFLYLLPNGFSYPTTITMSFFRAGFSVAYVPVQAASRVGKSHIVPLRDGLRFLLIIMKIGTLYSPLKIFFPASASFFIMGLGHYVYTYFTNHRFTNMSAMLFITSVLVLLIGLISEQITMLNYRDSDS